MDNIVIQHDMVAILREVIARNINRHPADDETWAALGFDSQSLINIVLDVEGETGTRFHDKLDDRDYDFEHGLWRDMAMHFLPWP